jgi:hypothetical protein
MVLISAQTAELNPKSKRDNHKKIRVPGGPCVRTNPVLNRKKRSEVEMG